MGLGPRSRPRGRGGSHLAFFIQSEPSISFARSNQFFLIFFKIYILANNSLGAIFCGFDPRPRPEPRTPRGYLAPDPATSGAVQELPYPILLLESKKGGLVVQSLNAILLLDKALNFLIIFVKYSVKLINISKFIKKLRQICRAFGKMGYFPCEPFLKILEHNMGMQ